MFNVMCLSERHLEALSSDENLVIECYKIAKADRSYIENAGVFEFYEKTLPLTIVDL